MVSPQVLYYQIIDSGSGFFFFSTSDAFQPPTHSINWWFGDQLQLDESYPTHHIIVPQDTAEPPPYTEVAQNGHISLGHSPAKPVTEGDPNGNMDSSVVTANNSSVLVQYSTGEHDHSSTSNEAETEWSINSAENIQEELPQVQSPFHPTRESTPVLGRRQLPPLQRSRSALDTSDGTILPQHRHSVSGVPLALPQSLPPRLRPISPLFLLEGQPTDGSIQTNEPSDQVENVGPFPVRPGRLPPLQPVNLDQQHRLSASFEGHNQLQRRRKKKRKRTHSWHGERLGTEIIPTIQEVSTLSTVAE